MKSTITSILIALIIVGGAFIFTKGNSKTPVDNISSGDNVTIENGIQIIKIKAKGGYFPRTSTAKVGIPTILRFDTNGTFDCSSSVRIPSLNISKSLPLSGITDIKLPSSDAGTLKGTCAMGMYPFEIVFQS